MEESSSVLSLVRAHASVVEGKRGERAELRRPKEFLLFSPSYAHTHARGKEKR